MHVSETVFVERRHVQVPHFGTQCSRQWPNVQGGLLLQVLMLFLLYGSTPPARGETPSLPIRVSGRGSYCLSRDTLALLFLSRDTLVLLFLSRDTLVLPGLKAPLPFGCIDRVVCEQPSKVPVADNTHGAVSKPRAQTGQVEDLRILS